MPDSILVKLFEHNNWANAQILDACSRLTDEQLDAEPQSATKGTIRRTLEHLVGSQWGYTSLLTRREPQFDRKSFPTLGDLAEGARMSGERLLALAKGEPGQLESRLKTSDGYWVEPWVVMIQVINHATEHREQINSMLSALGLRPMDQDGWTYGEVTGALVPVQGGPNRGR
jgi:uncharacterized damage-inducible protein DinB